MLSLLCALACGGVVSRDGRPQRDAAAEDGPPADAASFPEADTRATSMGDTGAPDVLPSSCCNSPSDCGDIVYQPCVEHKCLSSVVAAGRCWDATQCPHNDLCVGAQVCPCGQPCDTADVAGTCTPDGGAGADASYGSDSPSTDAASVADAPLADAPADAMALVLTMIQFGNLPINSIRWDVWGVDSPTGLCVDIVWDFSNTRHALGRHCNDFGPNFPYVFIAAAARARQPLHYFGNTQILSATGCIEFNTGIPQSVNSVDVTLQVQSTLYTGELRARN